jgi:E3 ubiquitin-protein ligase mind-bomb
MLINSAVGKLLGKARQLVDVQKDDGFAALHLAVLNGHYLVAKTLIEDGQAEINIRNNRKQTALTLSIAQGYSELVELLLSKGADISVEDEDGDTPLHTVLSRHFDGQSQQHSSHMPNPVVAMELKKLDNAPLIAEVCRALGCGI